MKKKLSEEFKRMQKIAGIIKENQSLSDDDIKQLANKAYNKWLSTYDPSDNFGDSTTFSGQEDDIINNNYEDDSNYSNARGFGVLEVATVYITKDENVANQIKNDFDEYKEYTSKDYYIIIVW